MKAWQFHRGEWQKVEFLEELSQGEGDIDELLRVAGFTKEMRLGHQFPYTFDIEIWWGEKEEIQWQVVVILGTNNRSNLIVVTDLPSFLMLLKELQPIRLLEFLQTYSSEGLVEKVFHAWHGHYLEETCERCDPMGTRT